MAFIHLHFNKLSLFLLPYCAAPPVPPGYVPARVVIAVDLANDSDDFENTKQFVKDIISRQKPSVGANGSEVIVVTYSTDNVSVLFNSSQLNVSNTAQALRAVSEIDLEAIELSNSTASLQSCLQYISGVFGVGSGPGRGGGGYTSAAANVFENTTVKNSVVLSASGNVMVEESSIETASILKRTGVEIVTVAVNVESTAEYTLQQISTHPADNYSFTCQGTSELVTLVEVVSSRLEVGKSFKARLCLCMHDCQAD